MMILNSTYWFFIILYVTSIYVHFIKCTEFSTSSSASNNTRLFAWFKLCQDESGASDEDFELIRKRKVPSSKEGTCMVECIFSKLHIINNGQFNQKGFVITFAPILRGNLGKLSVLREVAATCHKETINISASDDADKNCSITRAVLDCFRRNKDKLDLSKKSASSRL